MIDNIARVERPAREEFYEEYIRRQEPVVITGLFDGQPLAEIRDLDRLDAELGAMPVMISESFEDTYLRFVEGFVAGDPRYERRGTPAHLGEYIAGLRADPATSTICSEIPTVQWPALDTLYSAPDLARDADNLLSNYVGELWFANRGSYTHLHYDADNRNNLLYQFFGAKRALLVEPRYGRRLMTMQNNSFISPESVTEEESDDFVSYVHGRQTMVGPGETLFIPAMMWHSFYYAEPTIAMSMRFFRHPDTAPLASEHVLPSYYAQCISWELAGPRADQALRDSLGALSAVCARTYENGIERGRAIESVLGGIYERHLTGYPRGFWIRPFARAIGELIADLTQADYSGQPAAEPTGPRRHAEQVAMAADGAGS